MIYEVGTNKSFNKLSERLRLKGVKNCDFMLALFNKDLIGVDPYGDLSEDQKKAIKEECINNIWYFFREVVKISLETGDKIPYKLNEANLELIYSYTRGYSTWTTSPRGTLATATVVLLIAHHMMERYNNIYAITRPYRVGLISRSKIQADEIKFHISVILKNLPSYIIDDECALSIMDSIVTYECEDEFQALEIRKISKTLECINYYIDAEYIPAINKLYVPGALSFYTSVISDDAYINGVFDVLNQSIPFSKHMYDSGLSKVCDLIHIKKQLCELGHHEIEYDEMCQHMNYDEDYIRREILLERRLSL